MTEELRQYEHSLVEKIRRGRLEAWGPLLDLHEPRIADLAARWMIDEAEVASVVIDKLRYAVENYREGSASIWGFTKQLVDRALIDRTRKVEYTRKIHLSHIEERCGEHVPRAFVVREQEASVDTSLAWLLIHKELCRQIIYKNAPEAVTAVFRLYLNQRRAERCIGRKALYDVLGEFGIPDPQGKPIAQVPLFVDGLGASLVDDYCLLGERIMKAVTAGTQIRAVGAKIGENGKLVMAYRKHLQVVASLVAESDEQGIYEAGSKAVS